MSLSKTTQAAGFDFLAAVQFLTRIPTPNVPYDANSLSRAVKFFPVVGLLIGGTAALLHGLLAPHLSRLAAALAVVLFLAVITGLLHEDGLADVADGFGGGSNRERILLILKDSRIGSYGGAALVFSLLARVVLLASIPLAQVAHYLIAAHVLSRWTTLPLSYALASARAQEGQGARIARLTTRTSLVMGTLFTLAICIWVLRTHTLAPVLAAFLITLISGIYFKRKIGGVTGDCFGATNQLTEIAVYLTGAWIV